MNTNKTVRLVTALKVCLQYCRDEQEGASMFEDIIPSRLTRQQDLYAAHARILTEKYALELPADMNDFVTAMTPPSESVSVPTASQVDVAGQPSKRQRVQRYAPVKAQDRCGHCPSCLNRNLKKACETVRKKQMEDNRRQLEEYEAQLAAVEVLPDTANLLP